MKRNSQMQKMGIPKAGMREGHFLGFRNKHWHETAHIVGRHDIGLPIIEWTPQAVYVVHPVRQARQRLAMLLPAMLTRR